MSETNEQGGYDTKEYSTDSGEYTEMDLITLRAIGKAFSEEFSDEKLRSLAQAYLSQLHDQES